MYNENILIALSIILFLGISAQYIAWRLNMPSILFLLVFGFMIGPVANILKPDELFGGILMPAVSILVSIILFEGGLSLRLPEIQETKKIVMKLLSVGLMTTWFLAAFFAYFILKLDIRLCVLLGVILTVTGPTVIGPLLRHVQPAERLNSILKWEGIIIDPIGALLTFLAFETLFVLGLKKSWLLITWGIFKTVSIASLVGIVFAVILIVLMAKYWIPDRLHGVFALMLVVAAFTIANYFQAESGLWAATIMGIVLANQKKVPIDHIVEFKESLRILFVSSLFIVLGARFKLSNFSYFDAGMAVYLLLLLFVVRPISVFAATAKTTISLREKLFMSWMAPRGIVAAAIASIFAMDLNRLSYAQAGQWESAVFFVIISTVLIYGLSAKPVAKALGVANPNPQGVMIVGAHQWARALASALTQTGIKILMVDTNFSNIIRARRANLRAIYGNIFKEDIFYELPLNGIGHVLALTSNDEANSLVAINFIKLFGRAKVYQVHPDVSEGEEEKLHARHLRGRFLFGPEINYSFFTKKIYSGLEIESASFTDAETYQAFEERLGSKFTRLFLITQKKEVRFFTTDQALAPKPGDTLYYIKV